jgi:hypothetical protein
VAAVDDAAQEMTVVVIRAWYEGDQFRARIMFEARGDEQPKTVVVQTIDDVCSVFRNAVEAGRPPPA